MTADRWAAPAPRRRRPRRGDPRRRAAWQRLRLAVFERDGHACVRCGSAGPLECDHVVPLREGGAELDIGNAQTLCADCHRAKSALESGATPPDPAWRRLVEEARRGAQGLGGLLALAVLIGGAAALGCGIQDSPAPAPAATTPTAVPAGPAAPSASACFTADGRHLGAEARARQHMIGEVRTADGGSAPWRGFEVGALHRTTAPGGAVRLDMEYLGLLPGGSLHLLYSFEVDATCTARLVAVDGEPYEP